MLTDSRLGSRHQLGTEYVEKGKAKELRFSSRLAGHSLGEPSIRETWGRGFLADLTFRIGWAVFKKNKDADDPPNEMS